ncbi:MAG: (Fe-S)-binding protein [Phycisphaerae bacterium]
MNPIVMTVLLLVAFGAFAYSARKRWQLMRVAQTPENRADRIRQRIAATAQYALGQKRMVRYPLSGWAHIVVFFGFLVLLLNALILWGRGYVEDFDFWIFSEHQPLGVAYSFLRDIFIVLVILGVLVFYYYRLVGRLKRLTLNFEGVLILTIIFVMMIGDLIYEGAEFARQARHNAEMAAVTAGEAVQLFHGYAPFGSLFAMMMSGMSDGALSFWWHAGFWIHSALVLLFLNLLPYGKHFHVITVLPNVFAQNLDGIGRLKTIQDIEGRIEREETLGVKTVEDLSWKAVLDFYTCTECGRCSDHCPATSTGKKLSPKHLTIDLRDHMYKHQSHLISLPVKTNGAGESRDQVWLKEDEQFQLVGPTIDPEVIWACTTCGACEQECPVFISYVDKIVDLRRHMVMEQGEFPEQLQNAFRGLETVGNVYSFANEQRADWAAGLDVPLMADKPEAEYLYWVGCAPSFDDRSRKVARAFAELMREAGVDFAILGPEETCTGDPARRAGNEYVFQMFAQRNCETLSQYKFKKIITTCPHCYNTLKNEYGEFGGNYDVVHHTDLLLQLVRQGKLKPRDRVGGTIVYHDSCYLGRYNDVYDPPREILTSIPGLKLVEAAESRDRGMCCGAGGAQMWKEEEPGDTKVNHQRTNQLLKVLPDTSASCTVATACPFCMTMLTDGLRDQGHDDVQQLDVAEILLRSVRGSRGPAVEEAKASVSETA